MSKHLGIIDVREHYPPESIVRAFRNAHGGHFKQFDPCLTDENYNKPTDVLIPGQRLRVQLFKLEDDPGQADLSERLAFLRERGSLLPGLQGLCLVWLEWRDILPSHYWYLACDAPARLWQDENGKRRLPGFSMTEEGWKFGAAPADGMWSQQYCMLSYELVK